MRLQLPSVFSLIFDKARPGYLYYDEYFMHEVSKKEKKRNKHLSWQQAVWHYMKVGSDVEILLSCCKGCNVKTRQQEQGMVWQ